MTMDAAGLLHGLDRTTRHALPAASIALATIVFAIPGLLPAEAALRAAFVAGSVFFWSLYRPASLPAPVVALLGVLVDLLGASPLGLWAVLLLLEQGAIGMIRRMLVRQSFLLVWLVFAGFVAAMTASEWIARSVLDLTLLPAGPLIAQGLIAIVLYPLLAVGLIRAHRGAAAPERV